MLFNIFLVLHIAGGFTALVSGIAAMLTAKGKNAHRLSGKIYVWGMTASCASAVYLSIAHPNPFLFMIGVFSYQLVAMGYRSLGLKQLHKGATRPLPVDWIIGLVPGAFSVGMIGWGIWKLASGETFGVTALVFGVVSFSMAVRWLRAFFKPSNEKSGWLFAHLQSMGGAYIATSTAFLVVNVHTLPPVLVWLTPTAIGTIVISYATAKYKKQIQKNKPTFQVRRPESTTVAVETAA